MLDLVVEDADYTIVTRRDADDLMVMSLESFNSLMETVHLLKLPANAAHLERSIAQFRAGKAVEQDLLALSNCTRQPRVFINNSESKM